VSVEVEQFDFQMKPWSLSDLEAILNSCHSAYIQCFGLHSPLLKSSFLSSTYIQLKAQAFH
jgi:hypothetical protein